MHSRPLFLTLGFVAAGLLGYWLATTAAPRQSVRKKPAPTDVVAARPPAIAEVGPRFRRETRAPVLWRDDEAAAAGAIAGQRILVFKDKAALEEFLKRAGDKLLVLGRLDALNALRIAFSGDSDLASLLAGKAESSLIYPVNLPTPGDASAQPGAVALGAGLLDWLGITGDNSAWGKGVTVAVLDTGVAASSGFGSRISSLNLVEMLADGTAQSGHGTAVASMIIGRNSLTPGVAPGVDILSIRIANDAGESDSYLLAQGIVAAVDAGVSLINVSMGSVGDSALVRNAIEYARAAGTLIIAAAGNNGLKRLSYPAANSGVIAVGAVDALGNHLAFSNSGSQVAIAAPGFGVNAAWAGDQAASVSGTSFSAPIVTGAIAALMSQPGVAKLSPQQAQALLFAYLNDGGEAGNDVALGGGTPDIGRVLNGRKPGIYDAALASQRFIPADAAHPYGQIEIMVQNRGTETLINTGVRISTPNGVVNSNITSLPVNGVKTLRVPVPRKASGGPLAYNSEVQLSGGRTDSKPSNDRRAEIYGPSVGK